MRGVCWGGWERTACLVWFSYTAHPPPPVVLPAAAVDLLRLGGALRRASPFGLALPRVLGGGGERRAVSVSVPASALEPVGGEVWVRK